VAAIAAHAVTAGAAGASGGDARRAAMTLALLLAVLAAGSVRAAAPYETLEVVASRQGFQPRVVNVRRGQPVRLLLTTADVEHCFALDALRVEKRIVPDKTTVLDLTPDRSGTFPFYCCLETDAAADTENGRLVIIE
jgi:cupredoxin-like protein